MFQLKWVWKQMEGFRKRYIFALCSTALLAVLALGNSTITAMIMDTVFSPLQESGVVTEQVFQHLIFLVALLIGFTPVPHQLPVPVHHDLRGLLAKADFQAPPGFVQEHAGAGPGFLLQNPHRRLDDPPDRRLGHGALCRGLGAAAAHPLHGAVCHHLHCVPGDRLALRPVHAGGNAHHLRPYPGVLQACAPPVRRPAGAPLPAEYPGPGEHLRQPGGKGLCPGGLRNRALRREERRL